MTFLQPLLLIGLPLVALPIIIHLIHRHRHRTVKWAAMMFLLDAQRMTRGMARLKQILIMAMRMLAIAALLLAAARPLASGWIGLAAGGTPETTLILLDRSPSMAQQNLQTGESKLSSGVSKLAGLLEQLGSASRIVLIESTGLAPIEIESAAALRDLPEARTTDSASSLTGMFQAALDYLTVNQVGRTDIWVCSDLRRTDWEADSGRWASLRESLTQLEGVRFQLLAYPDVPRENVSVEVQSVKRRNVPGGAELVLDIRLLRQTESAVSANVPLTFLINGARSVHEVEMTDDELVLQGHVLPIDDNSATGWGRVELPADANPRDNFSCFCFASEAARHTVIVSDIAAVAEPFRIAATAPTDPNPNLEHTAEVFSTDRVEEIDWSRPSLAVWHASLPDGAIAQRLSNYVAEGRPILFLPPDEPSQQSLFGARWGEWSQSVNDDPFRVESWRQDEDLLANSQSGAALPVGDLNIYRRCAITAPGTVLARFADGQPLLVRVRPDAAEDSETSRNESSTLSASSSVWFCGTLPQASYSSLARDGIVFYIAVQRALEIGARALAPAQQYTAGSLDVPDLSLAEPYSDDTESIVSTERRFHAGVYQDGERLIALNRPASEDRLDVLSDEAISGLLSGLDYRVVTDQLDSGESLASEVWRAFLITMALALIVEAALCLPPKPEFRPDAISGFRANHEASA
ncbi:hypothetical protein GC176_18085 [bacterium]|nr:hypothetical protein [bacterium]